MLQGLDDTEQVIYVGTLNKATRGFRWKGAGT
jgi:hypothetical protein